VVSQEFIIIIREVVALFDELMPRRYNFFYLQHNELKGQEKSSPKKLFASYFSHHFGRSVFFYPMTVVHFHKLEIINYETNIWSVRLTVVCFFSRRYEEKSH